MLDEEEDENAALRSSAGSCKFKVGSAVVAVAAGCWAWAATKLAPSNAESASERRAKSKVRFSVIMLLLLLCVRTRAFGSVNPASARMLWSRSRALSVLETWKQ